MGKVDILVRQERQILGTDFQTAGMDWERASSPAFGSTTGRAIGFSGASSLGKGSIKNWVSGSHHPVSIVSVSIIQQISIDRYFTNHVLF